MSLDYTPAARALQDRFDTRRLADRLAARMAHDRFTQDDCAFISAMDMFFLASVDASGQPTCSYKGGDPGFVRVLDDRTLAFPNYDGNGMYLSMGNILRHAEIGMLFIDFERPSRVRVEGTASIDFDGKQPPASSYSFASALNIDDAGRVLLAGGHFYGKVGGVLISVEIEMTATRFVRDVIFASGFD